MCTQHNGQDDNKVFRFDLGAGNKASVQTDPISFWYLGEALG